jgi:acetoin utilization deacetylase AcuC-like enzyme
VLIIDLDAHGGGGTYSLVRRWPGVVHLDLAVSPYETYRPHVQSTLDYIRDAADYLPTLKARLGGLDDGPGFDLVIYNAGVDPYEGCDIGGLSGMTAAVLAERDQIVFEWAAAHGSPVAFVLAGGYVGNRLSQATLVDLHRQTIAAAVSALDPVAQQVSVKAPGPFGAVPSVMSRDWLAGSSESLVPQVGDNLIQEDGTKSRAT